jgi:hypothetical protein
MKENQVRYIFYLLLLVFAFLLTISALPDFYILGFQFKKPDLLADIRSNEIKRILSDSVRPTRDLIKKKAVVRRKGSLLVEEFGKDNLQHFFNAMRYSRERPVRIAFFGDSFIEGDILCGPFRDTLQQLFGGSGVGYMPITSEVTKFRTSIQHDFSGWKTYSMVGQKSIYAPLGFPGFCFKPTDENEVQYKPSKGNFVTAKFFYEGDFPFVVNSTLNDSINLQVDLSASKGVEEFVFPHHNFSSLKISFPKHDSLRLYGSAFEDSTGISVDNFAMRSNPGMGLLLIDQERLKQFNSLRDYKLIILQFGLNVLSEKDTTGYLWYLDKMTVLVTRLKENFPYCGFLLISVGDRSINLEGRFATMPGVYLMRDIQRKIAQKSGIAFWDMFEAMGGENSMVRYTESKPPLAAKDYTHLTFRGGRKIAKKLADALLKEKTKYGESR